MTKIDVNLMASATLNERMRNMSTSIIGFFSRRCRWTHSTPTTTPSARALIA